MIKDGCNGFSCKKLLIEILIQHVSDDEGKRNREIEIVEAYREEGEGREREKKREKKKEQGRRGEGERGTKPWACALVASMGATSG